MILAFMSKTTLSTWRTIDVYICPNSIVKLKQLFTLVNKLIINEIMDRYISLMIRKL